MGQKYNNSCDEKAGQKADILVPNLLLTSSIFGSYSCRRQTDRQSNWPSEFFGYDKQIDTHPHNVLISLQRVHGSLNTVQVRRNALYLTCQHAQLLKHLQLKFCLVWALQIENRKYIFKMENYIFLCIWDMRHKMQDMRHEMQSDHCYDILSKACIQPQPQPQPVTDTAS